MRQGGVEIICRYFTLEREKVESVENFECECTPRPGDSRRKAAKSQELYVAARSANGVVTSAESNVDGVYARKVDDDEVLLNWTWAWARRLPMTELNHHAEFLQGGVVVK